ncbi:MAG: sigma-70 family RNA polymerase sigma factor [Candidatus Hydrogenedentes bacterium]|nr:sigma-70 family RNA polymerase sigma factor [Candidatus Hydrogenedentota bacterium]
MSSDEHEMELAIVEACGRGDAQGWDRFVKQYGRLIRATVARICQRFGTSETELDDIVGHVYEKLIEDDCRRITAWRGRARLSTYLVQVVRNLVLDYQAKATRAPNGVSLDTIAEPPVAAVDHGQTEEDEQRLRALYTALDRLPSGYAVIVRMRLEGYSLRDIAAAQKKPVGTISVENSRALKKLKTTIDEILAVPPLSGERMDTQP